MGKKFRRAIRPLEESGISLRESRLIMHEMFAATVSNAPGNEIDNYTAKRITPVYLALCKMLENVGKLRKS